MKNNCLGGNKSKLIFVLHSHIWAKILYLQFHGDAAKLNQKMSDSFSQCVSQIFSMAGRWVMRGASLGQPAILLTQKVLGNVLSARHAEASTMAFIVGLWNYSFRFQSDFNAYIFCRLNQQTKHYILGFLSNVLTVIFSQKCTTTVPA